MLHWLEVEYSVPKLIFLGKHIVLWKYQNHCCQMTSIAQAHLLNSSSLSWKICLQILHLPLLPFPRSLPHCQAGSIFSKSTKSLSTTWSTISIVHISISQSFKHGGNVFHYINTLHEVLEFNWTTSTGTLNQLLKIFRINKNGKQSVFESVFKLFDQRNL